MPYQQRSRHQKPPKEVVLELGAECGSLTIFGICDPEFGWRFTKVRDETALRDMLPEDEQEGLEFYERSGYVASLIEALGLLECYPWHKLYPLQVHPEFRQRIFDAVISRYELEETRMIITLAGGRNYAGWTDLPATTPTIRFPSPPGPAPGGLLHARVRH